MAFCNDPPVSAQLKRLIGQPVQAFSISKLGLVAGCYTSAPMADDGLCLLDGFEVMEPNALLLHGSKQALDHAVLLRRMWRDELLFDAIAAIVNVAARAA